MESILLAGQQRSHISSDKSFRRQRLKAAHNKMQNESSTIQVRITQEIVLSNLYCQSEIRVIVPLKCSKRSPLNSQFIEELPIELSWLIVHFLMGCLALTPGTEKSNSSKMDRGI